MALFPVFSTQAGLPPEFDQRVLDSLSSLSGGQQQARQRGISDMTSRDPRFAGLGQSLSRESARTAADDLYAAKGNAQIGAMNQGLVDTRLQNDMDFQAAQNSLDRDLQKRLAETSLNYNKNIQGTGLSAEVGRAGIDQLSNFFKTIFMLAGGG